MTDVETVLSYHQPDSYATNRLGLNLHPKQAAVLRDIFPDPSKSTKSRVSFRKANEVGGTRTVIASAILYALEILGAEVISTSGKWSQVATQLIPALKRFKHLYPRTWDFQDGGIKISGLDRYIGFSTTSGFAQGYHRTEGKPLVAIIDEAGLVEKGIFDDMEDRCNPDYFLVAGAPMDPAGQFYDIESTRIAKFYIHHHLSQYDCLTENGWWIKRSDIEHKIAKYGSDQHPFIMSNIKGEFAAMVEGGLLSLAQFNACLTNPPQWTPNSSRHLFIDVGVTNLAAFRHGNKVIIARRWTVTPVNEIDQITGPIIRMAEELRQSAGLQRDEITVDGGGDYGKKVCDALAKMGWYVNRFFGQTKQTDDADYYNRLSEAWLGGARKIGACDIIIPDDDDFRAQCLSRKQRSGPDGTFRIEPKDEYIKRGFTSPHEADAIFGAMLPCSSNKSVSLGRPQDDEPEQRFEHPDWWKRIGYEPQESIVLPAESCL